jgi:hypothetical protein
MGYTGSMPFRIARPLARLLLAAMLTTFLSPSFGWHMHAEHHEIVPHVAHGDSQDDPPRGTDGGFDPHSSIGHLLGHLAMHAPRHIDAVPVLRPAAPVARAGLLLITAEFAPPYRPPLLRRLS